MSRYYEFHEGPGPDQTRELTAIEIKELEDVIEARRPKTISREDWQKRANDALHDYLDLGLSKEDARAATLTEMEQTLLSL